MCTATVNRVQILASWTLLWRPYHLISGGVSYFCFTKILHILHNVIVIINPLTPNDHYNGRIAPLTSKRYILYIYSTNIGTEYFKHGIYSSFSSLQNAVCFIALTYFVPVLFTFYIQDVPKLKKNNSGAKRLRNSVAYLWKTYDVFTLIMFLLNSLFTHNVKS
jgi:hypothetical protein